MVDIVDTLTITKRMEELGFVRNHAEGIAFELHTIHKSLKDFYINRDDLIEAKIDLKRDIFEIKRDLKIDIEFLRTDFLYKTNENRKEFIETKNSLKEEYKNYFKDFKIEIIKWIFGLLIIQMSLFLGIFLYIKP